MVDPTGLKPAPHGLKGRRSVTRAPDQEIGCGGRIRTFDTRINNPVPYQLGYATKGKEEEWLRRRELNSYHLVYKTSALEPIELRRKEFGGLGGIQTLTRSLQDFYALRYITSPKLWWLWVELNHQPRAYETLALFHLSYTAVDDLGSPRRS